MNKLLQGVQWRKQGLGLTALACALVLLLLAWWTHDVAQQALLEAPIAYSQQQATNMAAEESSRILVENLNYFKNLQEKGVVGDPKRLQWLETLQKLSTDYKLPEIQFSLGITQPVTQENSPYWNPEIAMKMTALRLDFKLLHEGDFYVLVNGLQREAQGLFSVENCTLERELNEGRKHTGLSGSCELLWYSLKNVVAHWEVQP